jgi:anti-sigma-K factor RskA
MDERAEMSEQIEELLPFYALNVLSGEEQVQVEAYLDRHSEARIELAELSRTAAALVFSAPPVQPPVSVKQVLLERASADVRRPQPAVQDRARPGLAGLLAGLWRPSGDLARFALAGLSMLVLILAGVWGLVVYNEVAWLTDQNARLTQELQAQRDVIASLQAGQTPAEEDKAVLEAELAAQRDTLAGLTQQLTSLNEQMTQLEATNASLRQELESQRWMMAQVTSPNVQTMSLSGTETLPGAHGQLIANPGETSAVLIVSGLPPLEPGQIYQFWLVEGEAQQGVGIFSVDEQGVGTLQISANTPLGAYDAMGVSVEPVGGSQQPTGEMIMSGSLPSTS